VLSLLHVSDIHFDWRYPDGSPWERNADVRNEMKEDVKRLAAEAGPIDGVLVGGDIAYRGARDEYDSATRWLSEIAELCGFELSSVWTVPGNHDIDRGVIESSQTLRWYRSRLRECDVSLIDEELEEILKNDPSGRTMFDPLANYNTFADPMGCAINVERPFWQVIFELPEGKRLLLRGVTSPLVSDGSDDDGDDRTRLVLGSVQALVPREAGRASLVMCHHPPDWLRDGDEASRRFRQRTQIQLYGHVHGAAIEERDGSLAITAGALHPERGAEWEPRYNLLRLAVDGASANGVLSVNLYPRVWSASDETFVADPGADGRDVWPFTLPLAISAALEPVAPVAVPTESVQMAPDEQGELRVMSPMRELLYAFATLPYARRLAIAQGLGLIEEADSGADEIELHRAIFSRARDRDRLADLWDAVAAERQDAVTNPFRE